MATTSFGFGSLLGSSSTGNMSFLSDYASLKNGSYRRLLKAYYGSGSSTSASSTSKASSSRFEVKNKANRYASDDADTTTKSKEETENTPKKALTTVQNNATSLKESADKLLSSDKGSVFEKVGKTDEEGNTTYDYDTDAIYKAVSSFVNDYNTALSAASKSTSSNVVHSAKAMINYTEMYRGTLSAVGISIDKNNQLSIDADKFKNANMDTVKSLFNEKNTYAGKISSQASLMNTYAKSAAAATSTYTSTGNYNYYDYSSLFSSSI